MKKAIVFIVLIVVIVVAAILARRIFSKPSDGNKVKEPQKSYIYTDVDKIITVTGKKEYDLEQKTNPDSLIDLTGKNEFRLLVSKIEGVESKTLNVIANADKEVYTSNYNEIKDVSETTPGMIDGKESFSYSFKYLDSTFNKNLVMQVHYVRVGDITYAIDIIHPAKDETETESENDNTLESNTTAENQNEINTETSDEYSEEITFLLSNMKFSEKQTEPTETVENQ